MSSLTQLHKLLWADGFTYKVEPGAKSRDLLSNGGAGGEASCRGTGCPRSFSFPKRLGDDALAYLLSIKDLAKTTIRRTIMGKRRSARARPFALAAGDAVEE